MIDPGNHEPLARKPGTHASLDCGHQRQIRGNHMQRSGEVEALLKTMYDLMRAGDGDAAAQLIADGDGVLFVGTDADEWWNSTERVSTTV